MRNRVVGALVLAVGILAGSVIAAAVPAPSAHASNLGEGGTLLLRDGEALFVASSSAAHEARRQPEPTVPKARILERRQRPNTVSLGVQGQYGAVRGNSRLADGFDQGPGYAFRFRYMLSTGVALGFSFEHQRYGSINPPANLQNEFADSHVVATTVSVEGIFFVHREREAVPYFIGGFGFATPDVIFSNFKGATDNEQPDDQSSRVNEGAFAVVGVGFERFVRPRFSIDASIRGYALVSNSEFTSMGQVSLGIHLYPGD
jgi:hypothetical protein